MNREITRNTVAEAIQAHGLLGASYARIWTDLGNPPSTAPDTIRSRLRTPIRHLLEDRQIVRAGSQPVARFIHREAVLEGAATILGPEAMARATRRATAESQAVLFPSQDSRPTEAPQEALVASQDPPRSMGRPEALTTSQEALVAHRGLRVVALSVGHDLTEGIVDLTLEAVAMDLEARGLGLFRVEVSQ